LHLKLNAFSIAPLIDAYLSNGIVKQQWSVFVSKLVWQSNEQIASQCVFKNQLKIYNYTVYFISRFTKRGHFSNAFIFSLIYYILFHCKPVRINININIHQLKILYSLSISVQQKGFNYIILTFINSIKMLSLVKDFKNIFNERYEV